MALRKWVGQLPMVVFVSACGNHEVKAFDDRAVDYLLKPVSLDRFRETARRLEERAAIRGGTDVSAQGRRHPASWDSQSGAGLLTMPMGRSGHQTRYL